MILSGLYVFPWRQSQIRANLSNSKLVNTRLVGAVLFEADLTGCELLLADLTDANPSSCRATGAHHGTGDDELVALPAVILVSVLHEQEESSGVEQLVELVYEEYNLPRGQVAELVDENFNAAKEISRMCA